jgi:hypothetical protein
MQPDPQATSLFDVVEQWAAAQLARTDVDPRLEPPEYADVADDAERNRLRWAWRDGFDAAVKVIREEVRRAA